MPRIVVEGGAVSDAEKLLGPSHSELAKVLEWDLGQWDHECDFLEHAPEATKVNLNVGYDLSTAAAGTRLGKKLPPGLQDLSLTMCKGTIDGFEALRLAERTPELQCLDAPCNALLLTAPEAGRRLGTALPL